MMIQNRYIFLGIICLPLLFTACKTPSIIEKTANTNVPESFGSTQNTANSATINWSEYFSDPYIVALIDTALQNNQELNITMQEINISQNEISARKGEYLPFVDIRGGAGVDKTARYTPLGANEATTDIEPSRQMPDPVPDFMLGAYANWEIDIWHKLRNGKKSAVMRYLATLEGRNFMQTNLVAEIAQSYYELLALDNELEIVKKNIEIQNNAFEIVKQQKQAARVTELAVRRFEAQVLKTKGLQFSIQQDITETENRINYLLGRYPQPIKRSIESFINFQPDSSFTGIPAQLLQNRPDIKQAELELAASKLDVKVAKARFYPTLDISAGVGLQAFNPAFFLRPESLLYSMAGDLAAPLINRNAIKAAYKSANAQQIQAVYKYEQTILNAYIEVANQVSMINNMNKRFELKQREVQALTRSVDISNDLFSSARADYMEVLLTQREALESKFELVETKMKKMTARVSLYRALGGGWN
jgi:NodT family efflux transporter outer membrane factor (OMF) lipoprotein